VGTFASIAFYSVLVIAGVMILSAAFSLLGIWLSDESEEDAAH
jgi:hypothetical protein